MSLTFHVRSIGATVVLAVSILSPLAQAVAGSTSGTLYEAFGNAGVAAVSLANPTQSFGNLGVSATNIVYAGNSVYFESGSTIYHSSATLQGLATVDVDNAAAPTAIAVNAAAGILYETFGVNGIVAVNLANPSEAFGSLNINATNVVYAGGNVYFESGTTIYESSATLHGLTAVDSLNGVAPTGIAVNSADGILYETFGADGIAAINLANPSQAFGILGVDATNVVYSGGEVYFQDGQTIYESSAVLHGLTAVDSINAVAPTDFAVMSTVPEPGAAVLMCAGLLGIAGRHFRERRGKGRAGN
jgi:hypothetical protein